MRVCLFTACGETFALPLESVIELFAADEVTPVPAAPPLVAGLVHRRGTVAPVTHLPPPLGPGGPVGAGQSLLLVASETARVALPVEQVVGMHTLDPDAASPARPRAPWIAARHEIDGFDAPVHLLDLDALVGYWASTVASEADAA